jgi:hypothetical protein
VQSQLDLRRVLALDDKVQYPLTKLNSWCKISWTYVVYSRWMIRIKLLVVQEPPNTWFWCPHNLGNGTSAVGWLFLYAMQYCLFCINGSGISWASRIICGRRDPISPSRWWMPHPRDNACLWALWKCSLPPLQQWVNVNKEQSRKLRFLSFIITLVISGKTSTGVSTVWRRYYACACLSTLRRQV